MGRSSYPIAEVSIGHLPIEKSRSSVRSRNTLAEEGEKKRRETGWLKTAISSGLISLLSVTSAWSDGEPWVESTRIMG